MADPAKILERVRAYGANICLDGADLQIVNLAKLPDGASNHISQHREAIAAWLSDEGDFEERAAIMEHDGGLPRREAEDLARLLQAHPPVGTDPGTWAWFVEQATEIIDRSGLRRAA
jgi:hypothetical protein